MAKDGGNPELKLAITPMIDVTFLLLIFFMLLPFRSLERKVQAQLPKDRGISSWSVFVRPKAKIEVLLARREGETITRIKLLDTLLGSGENGFRVLDDRIAAIHAKNDELPGFIHATAEVPHQDVIRCIDAFQKAGVDTLEFRGAPPHGSGRNGEY